MVCNRLNTPRDRLDTRDRPTSRRKERQLEESLGLWSEYGSGTYGAVASMFLDEFVKEGKVASRRDPDGRTWLYRTVTTAM